MLNSLWPLWTVAHQAPLSMGFSRQEYCSGLPFPSPGDLPNPGIKLASPAFPGRLFITEPLLQWNKSCQRTLPLNVSTGYCYFCADPCCQCVSSDTASYWDLASRGKSTQSPLELFAYQPKKTLQTWLVYFHNERDNLVNLRRGKWHHVGYVTTNSLFQSALTEAIWP